MKQRRRMERMTDDPKCPRCSTPLKIVPVLKPIKCESERSHADVEIVVIQYQGMFEKTEELADCPRCTGSF